MFSEGVASVVLEGKSYYIKPDGSPAFPATFDSAMPFCGGVASVETLHITESPDPRPACRSTWVKGKHGKIDHDWPRQGSMHTKRHPASEYRSWMWQALPGRGGNQFPGGNPVPSNGRWFINNPLCQVNFALSFTMTVRSPIMTALLSMGFLGVSFWPIESQGCTRA
jgi:hypothetical protein